MLIQIPFSMILFKASICLTIPFLKQIVTEQPLGQMKRNLFQIKGKWLEMFFFFFCNCGYRLKAQKKKKKKKKKKEIYENIDHQYGYRRPRTALFHL